MHTLREEYFSTVIIEATGHIDNASSPRARQLAARTETDCTVLSVGLCQLSSTTRTSACQTCVSAGDAQPDHSTAGDRIVTCKMPS